MCDPASIATAFAVTGSIIGGIGDKQTGDYNAKILENNALVRRRMAIDAGKRGDRDEAQHRMQVGQFKSQQKATMLAGGGTLTGSSGRLLDDTSLIGELDALTIRGNTARDVWGLNAEADNLENQADLSRSKGKFGLLSGILTAATNVASKWD